MYRASSPAGTDFLASEALRQLEVVRALGRRFPRPDPPARACVRAALRCVRAPGVSLRRAEGRC